MKKNMRIYNLLFVIVLVILLTTIPSGSAGTDSEGHTFKITSDETELSMAPINPAFIEYQKELEQEQKQEQENTDPETSVSEDIFIMALSGESSGSASTEKLSSQLFFNEIATDEDLLHTTGLIPSPVDLSFVSSSGNVAAVSPASGQTMPDAQPYPGSSQEKPASSLMALSGLLVVTTVASVYRMKRSK